MKTFIEYINEIENNKSGTNSPYKYNHVFKQWTVFLEKRDACYHKVKSRYHVWPSAYGSGALVKCRKVGARNWGNSRRNETTETIETDSTINNMEEQHSIFKGDFSKKGSLEAKYFLKHFRAIKTEFLDEDSATKILRHIFGGTEDELAKLVKDNDKKDKIKAEAFVPTNLEKPKKAIDLFGVLFSKESKEKGIKFNNSDNNYLTARKTAWDKLPVKTQSTYVKQAELELKNYTLK